MVIPEYRWCIKCNRRQIMNIPLHLLYSDDIKWKCSGSCILYKNADEERKVYKKYNSIQLTIYTLRCRLLAIQRANYRSTCSVTYDVWKNKKRRLIKHLDTAIEKKAEEMVVQYKLVNNSSDSTNLELSIHFNCMF